MNTEAKAERFRELAAELAALQAPADKLKLEMMRLTFEMSTEIVREAFPNARLVTIRAVSEIRPTDQARGAQEAVRLIRENRVTPNIIITDEARCTVVVGIEKDLPPAAKKKIAKRRK